MLSRGQKILLMLKTNEKENVDDFIADQTYSENPVDNNNYCNLNDIPIVFEDDLIVNNELVIQDVEHHTNIAEDLTVISNSKNNYHLLETDVDILNSSNYDKNFPHQDCLPTTIVQETEDCLLASFTVGTDISPKTHTCLVPYESSKSSDKSSNENESYEPEIENTSSRDENIENGTNNNGNDIDEHKELMNLHELKRKSQGNKENWKRERNKKLRMEGLEYLGFTKKKGEKMKQDKMRSKRILKPACRSVVCKSSKKKRNCWKFTEECRQEIFNTFWKHMDWKQRKVFVASNVRKIPTKVRTKEDSRRKGTFEYFLNDGKQNSLQVCRAMFVNTLALGYKTVQEWANNSSYGMAIENRSDVSMSESVLSRYTTDYQFLNKFFSGLPKLPAHYCRQDTAKLYLENNFNSMTDLYKVYKSACSDENCKPVNRNIFNKKFRENNLALYQQKKDQCNICFSYKYQNITEQEYLGHIERKEKARKSKSDDKEKAEKGECVVLTMDLQAVKLCPFLPAGKVYFKTKLCCHNFTFFDLTTRNATCYWFSEDQNNELKASTFTSIIIDYIIEKCLTKDIPIIIYSDGCGYQNRNNVLSNALLNLAIQRKVTIFQKYLEPGHTQMECDSVHSLIERKLKNKEIHLPSDYATVTKEARSKPNPYEVKLLDFSFFKDYSQSQHLRYSSIRPGKVASDPVINSIKVIKYSPEGIITVKLDYDQDEFLDLPVRVKPMEPILEYPPLFNGPCKIKLEKWRHLQELKTVLPKDTHPFYDNLPHT